MKAKHLLLYILLFVSISGYGQSVDTSAIIKEIHEFEIVDKDAIYEFNGLFRANRKYLKTHHIDTFAQKIITSCHEFGEDSLLYSISYRLFYMHKTLTLDLDKELFYAKEHYEATLRQEDEKKVNRLSQAVNNLGIAYHDRNDLYNAIKYYLKAIEYSKVSDLPGDASLPLSNIASVYGLLGDYDNALKYLSYSLPYGLIEEDTVWRAANESMVYLTKARIYIELEEQDSVAKYRDKNLVPLQILRKESSPELKEHVCNSYLLAAKTFLQTNSVDSAKYFLDLSAYCKAYAKEVYQLVEFNYCLESNECGNLSTTFDIIKENWSKEKENDSYDYFLILQELFYKKTDQIGKAYQAHQELYDYDLNKSNKKRANFAAYAAAQFENIENQERIKEVQRRRIEQEKNHKKEKWTLSLLAIVISVFVFILSIISYFLYKLANSRKKISEELILNNQKLATLNETKTRFFTNVSHELKTPLTLIINPLQKLRKFKSLSEDQSYLVKTAEKNSLDLLDLTIQLLELTKFESNRVEINDTNFNFYNLLQKLYADFESLLMSKSITFKVDYEGNKDLTILGDHYKIQSILKNLLTNAVKFSHPGDSIHIKAVEEESNLLFEVHDTGRGIHIQDLPHIFDRYYQTSFSKSLSEGGNGIGLAICKEYVKALGGSITVSSEYGSQTTFKISLPKIIAQETIPNTEQFVQRKSHQAPLQRRHKLNNKKSTILIVEDNFDLQEYLRYTLEDEYNIFIANNGVEGLNLLEINYRNIDLIISDIMMPVMDGFEFLNKVKSEKNLALIPFILLTALNDKENKIEGLKAGIDDFLTKPFDNEELTARIDNLLSNLEEKRAFHMISESEANLDERVGNSLLTTQTHISTHQEDNNWLSQLEKIVNDNISDYNFTVDDLAHKIGSSRSILYRKVKGLTGLTPNNYMIEVRLKKARFYLETKKFSSVKKVAFEVGFKDEKYFSRKFRLFFGKYPSDFL